MAAQSIYQEDYLDNPDGPPLPEGEIWKPEPEIVEDPILLETKRRALKNIPRVKPSEFTKYSFLMPTTVGEGEEQRTELRRFSFDERRHMLRCYDTSAPRVLFMCGRQVEKCFATSQTQLVLASGMPIQAFDIEVGQKVLSWDEKKQRVRAATVVAKKEVGSKTCRLILTRQGHELRVADTHPILTSRGWVETKELKVGDRVGAIRRGGEFGRKKPNPNWAALLAYLIADGSLGVNGYLSFSKGPGVVCDDFFTRLKLLYDYTPVTYTKGDRAADHRINLFPLSDKLKEVGLWGCYSADKFIPEEVFHYDREHTSLFLNRLWSCDGSVGHPETSKYDIEYSSTSLRLVRQVQALLWKFGIPTSFRRYKPEAYKDTDKWGYILRVETRLGVKRFLTEIGALGKSEKVDLPDESVAERNNRDSIPPDLVRRCIEEALPKGRSLRSIGLERLPRVGVTQSSLLTLIEKLRVSGAKRGPLKNLEALLDSDIYWDVIEEIEDLGDTPCFDIEVEQTHNFLLNGVFTHNSTLLGNIALCYSCIVPGYRTLFVSPSGQQTETFSKDRIAEPIETSPVLKRFTTSMLSQNIMEKQFVNRSKITLRYAFLNADRTRGIAAWLLAIDEIQDILEDNIPVIEQCTSHAPSQWKRFIYSGTPKSMDNTIESYWSRNSTQCEWVVPCGCNHWNILGEDNIGKKGLICSKCGARIHPMRPESQWASMVKMDPPLVSFEGYRIPQLMVPWRPWNDIIIDYEKYSRARFYNEVLGRSYDSGMRPLTQADIKACCRSDISMYDIESYRQVGFGQSVYAGIDWGTGEQAYTVITLATYVEGKFRVFYQHRFTGREVEPDVQLGLIEQLLDYFNVKYIGVDYGGGYYPNDRLTRRYGKNRVWKYQYVGQQRAKVVWSQELGRFTVRRNDVMADIFNAIKRGDRCELPKWEEFENPHATDFLNIFAEYNEARKLVQYRHPPGKPDDSFHSLLYAWLASMLEYPRPDLISPDQEDAAGNPIPTYIGPVLT